MGNRYIQRSPIQEFAMPDGFDLQQQQQQQQQQQPGIKYSAAYMQAAYAAQNGQGYNRNLGWNGGGGYQGGHNVFNPYQKLGYGYQNPTGYNGQHPVMGFADGGGGGHHQLFGLPQQPVHHFVGNKRIRI
ncbi:Hypothetical protein CINCED_3A003984 [Cinara cedri]|uniref:Uncharacterized protein n=1 Tax=Cinara cedri TaxID=506608 RepID=A0A5E4MBT9_9HEMI|nr:Hypothetical protein CINCED_3A003984 [Cinara cedri]